jgi:hypothetical protein
MKASSMGWAPGAFRTRLFWNAKAGWLCKGDLGLCPAGGLPGQHQQSALLWSTVPRNVVSHEGFVP